MTSTNMSWFDLKACRLVSDWWEPQMTPASPPTSPLRRSVARAGVLVSRPVKMSSVARHSRFSNWHRSLNLVLIPGRIFVLLYAKLFAKEQVFLIAVWDLCRSMSRWDLQSLRRGKGLQLCGSVSCLVFYERMILQQKLAKKKTLAT